jgi:hypothetical protein
VVHRRGRVENGETGGGVGDTFLWRRRRGGKGQGVRLGATWGQEKERRGAGRGAVPRGLARHGRGGSGPLGQLQAAHASWTRWARYEQGRWQGRERCGHDG